MSYLNYFKLSENPFLNEFCFETKEQKEAMARFEFLLETGGIMHLYGDYGVGKTLLLKNFIKNLPGNYQSVLIEYTALEPYCFLLQISNEIGLQNRNNTTNIVTQIHKFIKETNKNIVIIVDEAQELKTDSIEALKLIINPYLSTNKISLIISSALSFKKRLSACPSFKQRINYQFFLTPLNIDESKNYLYARLKNVNCSSTIFADEAVNQIAQLTEGIPRQINKFASFCLINAMSENKKFIDLQVVENVRKELSLY
jgi:type II secretory pathway predicted ATPase ExeA